MKLGASFSHPHLRSFDIDPLKAIVEFKTLNLHWIRLGCYWDEIEEEQGKFNFSKLDTLIEFCEKNNLKVVLTVGMKAPRYPEYYIPKWLEKKLNLEKDTVITKKNKRLLDATLNLLEITLNRFKEYSSVKVWQMENEPLDPAGEKGLRISPEFLQEEASLIRKIDPSRQLKINVWGNKLKSRGYYKDAMKISNIVGLTLFLREPGPNFDKTHTYIGPHDTRREIKKIVSYIKSHNKKVWITELQAEPWEPDEIVTKKKNPPSFLPKHFESNLQYARGLNPEVVLLWGFEYWYWRKMNGDLRYWTKAKETIKKYQNK